MKFKKSLFNNLPSLLSGRLAGSMVALAIGAGVSGTVFSAAPEQSFVQKAHLPTDVYDGCTVKKSEMAKWFSNKKITANGAVNPADSTAIKFSQGQTNTRCDFYQWGAQMFLWLTSETGHPDKHVMSQSPIFYDISISAASIGSRNFVADNGTMILEPGAKTENSIEFGEASDSDILIAEDNDVVYFALHANNVYALYATAVNEGMFDNMESTPKHQFPNAFPTTQDDLDSLKSVLSNSAYANYLPIDKSTALAMELKTAWVDATAFSAEKLKGYISTEAEVPVFDTASPYGPWPIASMQKKTLALIGMHVVGTVNGHPEMIWSTFEHVNNAPANAYTYNTNNAKTPATNTQPYDSTTNDWTLAPKGVALPTSIDATANVVPCVVGQAPTQAQIDQYSAASLTISECASGAFGDKGSITSQIMSKSSPAEAIVKTDVARIHAWGGGTVANNTDLISLNKSVLTWLQPGDYRGNYIQTGGIWTSDGSIPTNNKTADNPKLTGSLNLANTTMETFDQIFTSSGGFQPTNCFGCHNTGPQSIGSTNKKEAVDGTEISHIFGDMNSLSLTPQAIVEADKAANTK